MNFPEDTLRWYKNVDVTKNERVIHFYVYTRVGILRTLMRSFCHKIKCFDHLKNHSEFTHIITRSCACTNLVLRFPEFKFDAYYSHLPQFIFRNLTETVINGREEPRVLFFSLISFFLSFLFFFFFWLTTNYSGIGHSEIWYFLYIFTYTKLFPLYKRTYLLRLLGAIVINYFDLILNQFRVTGKEYASRIGKKNIRKHGYEVWIAGNQSSDRIFAFSIVWGHALVP